MRPFYKVRDIPVHSVLLMPSREAAVSYPRRDLRLSFCGGCGFISNVLFDQSIHEYSARYEETQGFSATFNAFARSLAQRWIDRYDLRHKRIIEIGCGKGEFLAMLCAMGDNRGIGIDPAYVPQRMPAEAAGRVEFIQDFYSGKYAHLPGDVICCRHTLEHIAQTGAFMRMIRRAIGDRDMIVLFELPDVRRVLKEGAFWDIYYEHCSYFSAGSLARLFRMSGFEVVELKRDFDDQYLLIGARPAAEPTRPTLPRVDDTPDLARLIDQFGCRVGDQVERMRRQILAMAADGKRVVLWGAGSKGVALLTTLKLQSEIANVIDINPYKQGQFMPGSGHEVLAPQDLKQVRPDLIIVMNPVYLPEIRLMLSELAIDAELRPVNASFGAGDQFTQD